MNVVSLAIIKLCLVALLGFYFYKKGIIKEEILGFLTFFVINFTVPCLIFSHLIENSKMVLKHSLWIYIILSVSIFLAGYLLGFIVSFWRTHQFKREFVSLVSFQNAGYLPMNLAIFLFPPGVRQRFLVYIFLYLLGFNIIMWALGSFFIFKKDGDKFNFKSLFTPPIVSTFVALLLIYSRVSTFVPALIIDPVKMVGTLSFVLSMIVLGCWLAKVKLSGLTKRLYIIGEVSFLKLIILPGLFFIAVLNLKIFSLLGVFIVFEAAMPSAASLPIVANLRGADSEFVSQGVLITHLLGIFSIPVWLYLLEVFGFSFF